MLKDTSTGLIGNDRFEGFGIDLIDELSKLYGFKYNYIQVGQDYGKYDNLTNTWTYVFIIFSNAINRFINEFILFSYSGMIGMVMNGVC